jgi:hypothetical protein
MKSLFWALTGACAAMTGLMLWSPKRTQPAHKLPYLLERIRPADEPDSPWIAG